MSQENPTVEGKEVFSFDLDDGWHVNVTLSDGEQEVRVGGATDPGQYALVERSAKTNNDDA